MRYTGYIRPNTYKGGTYEMGEGMKRISAYTKIRRAIEQERGRLTYAEINELINLLKRLGEE